MPEPWAADFSYAYYRRLLHALQSSWRPRLFRDAPVALQQEQPLVFVRHDVDVSLERALQMARLEREEGVPATYMVMNSGLLYSLASPDSRRALREIAGLGHEIGLHFDYPDSSRIAGGATPELLDSEIRRACTELEDSAGEPVRSLSFHRPVPAVIRGPLLIAERVNGYAAELMQRYISDSKGQWREGDPLQLIQQTAAPVLQVLTHPIWWGPLHGGAADRLDEFVAERVSVLNAEDGRRFAEELAATLPGVPWRLR